jgi:dTDP-4-dehydrorhamnose reductase
MLRLAAEGREIRVVNDQVLTPTSAKELARKVRQLVETRAYEETISPRCAKYAVC